MTLKLALEANYKNNKMKKILKSRKLLALSFKSTALDINYLLHDIFELNVCKKDFPKKFFT